MKMMYVVKNFGEDDCGIWADVGVFDSLAKAEKRFEELIISAMANWERNYDKDGVEIAKGNYYWEAIWTYDGHYYQKIEIVFAELNA